MPRERVLPTLAAVVSTQLYCHRGEDEAVALPLVEPAPVIDIAVTSRDHWLPVRDVSTVVGGWRSPDGEVLVQVYPSGSGSYWRLDVDLLEGPSRSCALFEGLQGDPPWRLGSCREEGPSEGDVAVMTEVRLWVVPGTPRALLQVEGLVRSELWRLP